MNSKKEEELVEEIILSLFEIGSIKFGEFTLKSGIKSPIYIDLRLIVSYPKLLSKISDFVWSKVSDLECDVICGVPYTALPIATCISIKYNQPMIMKRKETKKYGTKKQIEGVFKKGQKCLIIEDLVTSGTSVLETVNTLNKVGLQVSDAVVLINRQQGGEINLKENKINLHACYTISTMLELLLKHEKIDNKMCDKVNQFLKDNSKVKSKTNTNKITTEKKRLTFAARSDLCDNEIAKKLLSIMESKKTNLCCSADVRTVKEVLDLCEKIGDCICMLKTHIDIITDYNADFLVKLQKIAKEKNFLIFEDRKFADIGNTVKSQFGGGIYKIADWAHITNCHSVPGPGIIEGLKQVSMEKDDEKSGVKHGLLLLAEMSSKGNLATNEYTNTTVQWAEDNCDFVIGFICRKKLSENPKLINMTPGVHLKAKNDNLGQVFLTPETVIGENGSDIIIVGRGIYKADDPLKAAQSYRDAAWNAYTNSLN